MSCNEEDGHGERFEEISSDAVSQRSSHHHLSQGFAGGLFTLEVHISTLTWGGDSKVFWNVFGWNGHVDSQVGSQGLRLHFL
jgi:hypothetical protein